MNDASHALVEFKPTHRFLVGIDSDGCVFDSMEIKHKECFVPMFVKHFALQAVSKYAREAWEFVNLYSLTRGVNRFPALSRTLNLLREHPAVVARRVSVPETRELDDWIAREARLSNASLAVEIERNRASLAVVLAWSEAVNAQIADLVHGVPPFPLVRECLDRIKVSADMIVVSQTPGEALRREWAEHDLGRYAALIAGQELGTKSDHLRLAAGGKYPPQGVLMIGDAPGDLQAARAVGARFFPINPGAEEASWAELHSQGLTRFFDGTFAGDYQDSLLRLFEARLPSEPPWLRTTPPD